MNNKGKEVLVLGCGVSGLSTGILLLKNGYGVTIWAKDLPPNTTSNKAAAVWYPYLCYPRDKAIPWALSTFKYITQNVINEPKSGCIMRTVTEMFDKTQKDPWWKAGYPGIIERPSKPELPDGYVDAYRIESIVIDTSIYMDFLVNTFNSLGGHIIQRTVENIKEATQDHQHIVNCTGLGSRDLFHDNKLFPVRGQMVKIKATSFDKVVVDDDGPNNLSLVVPRVADIMLGGTVQVNNWNTDVNPDDTKEILRKVKIIAPQLKNIEVIDVSVGLRPARDAVRLESENFDGKVIVHNYGHGGSGFTLSWGCAEDVVEIIKGL